MVRPQPRREVLKIPGVRVPYLASLSLREGETLQVEKLNAEVGAEVVFEEVLTVVNDADVKIGKPVVEGAKVVAKVVEHGKADKIFVFKYKAKSNYRKRQGHRQPFTTVEITAINA